MVGAAKRESRDSAGHTDISIRSVKNRQNSSLLITSLNPHEGCHVEKTVAIDSDAGSATLGRFVGRFNTEERFLICRQAIRFYLIGQDPPPSWIADVDGGFIG